jgi:hypothetical protein
LTPLELVQTTGSNVVDLPHLLNSALLINHSMKARILLLALTSTGFASAASIIQSQNYSFVPTNSITFTFNKFDAATYGTLTSIVITTEVTKSAGSLFVDNESSEPATGDISQSVTINLNSVDVDLLASPSGFIGTNVNAISTYAAFTGPDDGDGPLLQPGGVDYDGTFFGPTTTTLVQTVRALVMPEYIGTGTYDIDVNATQGFDASAFGGAAIGITPANAAGSVTVEYIYTPIPEPASALLGGLGCLALLRRRR